MDLYRLIGASSMSRKEVSKAVLKRLPGYVAYLRSIPEGGSIYISATALANALGMGEVQVRKDLALVSDGGRPKVGYHRESLIEDIEQFLGYDNTTDAVLIGAGKLGQALLGYVGFDAYGLNILAAFDAKPALDRTGEGKPIYSMDQLEGFCKSNKVLMGIITVPVQSAQRFATD
jgi:redox-sensing transcriptional repressor